MNENLLQMTKGLWDTYFFGDENGNYQKLEYMTDDCVIIGTGRHEFYEHLQHFSMALAEEVKERSEIRFQYRDFWARQKDLTPEVSMVYGTMSIWWESDDKSVRIDMDSRFTIIYKKMEEGWKIVHLHQSMPNMDQQDGEYYPKTLSEQLKEGRMRERLLEELAQKDALTGLLNYSALNAIYEEAEHPDGTLFVIDLNDFKSINDIYGHMEGNQVLKKIAEVLKHSVRDTDIACRVGGDEFALLCRNLSNEEEAEKMRQRIIGNVQEAGKTEKVWAGISIGKALINRDDTLEDAFRRADKAMYEMKAGKNWGGAAE